MDWGRLRFFLSEVWRSFTRNVVMQLTAIGTVTISIAVLGAFLFARELVAHVGDETLRKIEISVFLSDRLDAAAGRALAARIARDHRVRDDVFVPRAQGLRELGDRMKGQIDTTLLTSNPLPDAIRVRLVRPDDVIAVASHVRTLPGVKTVEYAHEAVSKLVRLTDVLARIGWGAIGLLVSTAAIIISNTIRLTVFARRREIAIMQLVGASGAYIRAPFIFEGFIDGLLGSALALGLLALARLELLPKLAAAIPFLPFQTHGAHDLTFALELLGVGGAVGLVASWISVGRYLRA